MEGSFRVCLGCSRKGRWALGGLWGRRVGWKLEEEGFGITGFQRMRVRISTGYEKRERNFEYRCWNLQC
jgi:hypothetical protein